MRLRSVSWIAGLFALLLSIAVDARGQSPVVPVSAIVHGSMLELRFSGAVQCSTTCGGFTVRRVDGSKDFRYSSAIELPDWRLRLQYRSAVEWTDDVLVEYRAGDLRDGVFQPIADFTVRVVNTTGVPTIAPVSAAAVGDHVGVRLSGPHTCGLSCGTGFVVRSTDGTKELLSTGSQSVEPGMLILSLTAAVDPADDWVLHYTAGSVLDAANENPVAPFGPFRIATPFPKTRDFNRDRLADLVWQNASTGQVAVSDLGGPEGVGEGYRWTANTSSADWRLAFAGDFNRDGTADLAWQHNVVGSLALTYMTGANGNVPAAQTWLAASGSADWTAVAAADVNHDGTPDVVWQHKATRQALVWYMGGRDGNSLYRQAWLVPVGVQGWTIAAAEDFDGDWVPDLVWQDDSTRQVEIWYMTGLNGTELRSRTMLPEASESNVVGAGDFDRDGNTDLVWQHPTTSLVEIWYLGGADRTTVLHRESLPPTVVTGWRVMSR